MAESSVPGAVGEPGEAGRTLYEVYWRIRWDEGDPAPQWEQLPEQKRQRWVKVEQEASGGAVGLGTRLFNAVRQVITEGIDHPGVNDELHLAFYEVRDGSGGAVGEREEPDVERLRKAWYGHEDTHPGLPCVAVKCVEEVAFAYSKGK